MDDLATIVGGRILILGPPGSGKTTLARELQAASGLPHYELDNYFWQPGWRKTETVRFGEQVSRFAESANWIIDGQYAAEMDTVVSRADTLIWLDPPLAVACLRVLRRSARNLLGRKEICNGNRENPAALVGLLAWTLRSYRPARDRNRELYTRMSAKGVVCVRR